MTDAMFKPNVAAIPPKTLSPDLYQRLKEEFRDVQIANQGSTAYHFPPMYQGDRGSWKGGEYFRVNCPLCNDTRKRLWVSYLYGQLDDRNRLLTNVAHCFNEQCLDKPENAEKFRDAMLGFRNMSTRQVAAFKLADPEWSDTAKNNVTPILPDALIPFMQLMHNYPNHPAVIYMLGDRRYTPEQLDHYEVSYCISSARFPGASGRVVFPLFMHGRLAGWQARYVGTPPNKIVQKYYNMPNIQKQFILANFDNAKDKHFTVLFEGVTDVHRLGDYGMAVLGKTLSPVHKTLLAQHFKNKPIFIGFDPDAEGMNDRAIKELEAIGLKAYPLVFHNNMDPSDFEHEALVGTIRYQARQVGITI